MTSLLYPPAGIALFRLKYITVSLYVHVKTRFHLICKFSKLWVLEREKKERKDVLCHADFCRIAVQLPKTALAPWSTSHESNTLQVLPRRRPQHAKAESIEPRIGLAEPPGSVGEKDMETVSQTASASTKRFWRQPSSWAAIFVGLAMKISFVWTKRRFNG